MLGELSGEDEPDSSLDLPGCNGGLLVVEGKSSCLSGHLSLWKMHGQSCFIVSIIHNLLREWEDGERTQLASEIEMSSHLVEDVVNE